MSEYNDPRIVVGFRRKDEPEKDYGPEMYFHINILGIARALREAQEYLEKQSKIFLTILMKILTVVSSHKRQ